MPERQQPKNAGRKSRGSRYASRTRSALFVTCARRNAMAAARSQRSAFVNRASLDLSAEANARRLGVVSARRINSWLKFTRFPFTLVVNDGAFHELCHALLRMSLIQTDTRVDSARHDLRRDFRSCRGWRTGCSPTSKSLMRIWLSRVARNSREWQQLVEVCLVIDTVLIDQETIFHRTIALPLSECRTSCPCAIFSRRHCTY